jgi:HAD superfamily hydrolase (TIGR01509 family)
MTRGMRGVILDMDGLLLDTEPMAHRAFQHASGVLGCEFGEDVFVRLLGLNAPSARDLLRRHYGDAFPLERFLEAVREEYERLLDTEGVPHKPGLVEFLGFLNARKLPRVVATSTATAAALQILSRAGVRGDLPYVIGGDQVRRGKPAPDIFLAAAERLGRLPRECVVLEDSAPGIQAAAAAGMIPILIPDAHEPAPETRALAYAVVDSLLQAQAVLDELSVQRGGRLEG